MKKIESSENIVFNLIPQYIQTNKPASERDLINLLNSPDFLLLIKKFIDNQKGQTQWKFSAPCFLIGQNLRYVLSANAMKDVIELVRIEGKDLNKAHHMLLYPVSKFRYSTSLSVKQADFYNISGGSTAASEADLSVKQADFYKPPGNKFLFIAEFLFSPTIYQQTFKTLVADLQEEYFEALSKKEIWKSRWIKIRYTYAFLAAMWQKSPLGDLIEFISKIAK